MGKRGPTPRPTELKVLQGNPGRRPLNDQEIKPPVPAEVPNPPPILGTYGKREWNRMAPLLHKNKLLTEFDLTALASYCQAYDRWITAEKQVRAKGITYVSDKGNVIQRPEVGIANKAMEDLLRYGREFGLTPSSRSSLKIAMEEEREDPLLTLMQGVKKRNG